MREHTHLPAMVGFVRKHVAQHFHAHRPRPSPAVSAKLLDTASTTAERFSENLRAASGALGQSRTGLLRRAVRAVELSWNLQVRSCKPDPLTADIVHVREDRRNGAGLAGRFGSPGGRVKMFDKNLVHSIIGGKDPDCGSAELRVNLGWTRGYGSLTVLTMEAGRPRPAGRAGRPASIVRRNQTILLSHLQRRADRLDLGVLLQYFVAHFASPAGLLVSAEGQGSIENVVAVDPHRPGAELGS